jgi:uncharacterized membrane protein YebE (DUF533 family)
MLDSQYLSVIRVWAALVWADGELSDQEAAAMRRLIHAADLTDAEREAALGYLERKVDLDIAGLEALGAAAREGVYRAAVKLSGIDNDVADAEIEFLGRLRVGLGLDDATAERIEDSVAAES